MSTLYNMEAANLFLGSGDETGSFLRMKNVKVPDLKEMKETHEPGGGLMAIDLGMGILESLMLTFELHGVNADAVTQFMPAGPRSLTYTVRGNVVDVRTDAEVPVVSVITGRMMGIETKEFERSSGTTESYEICEVKKYQVFFNNNEVLFFDFASSVHRRDGVQVNGTRNRNLGIA